MSAIAVCRMDCAVAPSAALVRVLGQLASVLCGSSLNLPTAICLKSAAVCTSAAAAAVAAPASLLDQPIVLRG